MARVFLTTTADNNLVSTSRDDFDRIHESARLDKGDKHQLTKNPEQADIILFVGALESDFWDVRYHPLVRCYPDRCFMYHSEDHIFPFLPGVFPSIKPRDMYLNRVKSGGYSAVLHIDLPFMPFEKNCPYLFSFCGAFSTARFRRELGQFRDYPLAIIIDTSAEPPPPKGYHAPGTHRDRNAQIMRQSKFILCPRGRSISSWRLFETLKVGRVPVIIADDWMPPAIDIPWEHFSVRVREADLPGIPDILRECEPRAPTMAALARKVWEDWFSREMFFHRVVEWCLAIQTERSVGERAVRMMTIAHLMHPFNIRYFVLPRLKKLVLSKILMRQYNLV